MNVYCSKGHENPSDSRFCLHCGEKLDAVINQGIQSGQTLSDRYLIVRQLGQGGFGRTYLAEDINRFRELCVLKEFSPQVQTAYVLKKQKNYFKEKRLFSTSYNIRKFPVSANCFAVILITKSTCF